MRAKKGKPNKSWVESSFDNLKYFIGADFVDQLESRINLQGLTQRTFAEKLGVTEGRVSQIFNNPGNLTLDTMVSWGQAVGMKTGVILYGEGSGETTLGPVSGQIFVDCWRRSGEPRIRLDSPLHQYRQEVCSVNWQNNTTTKTVSLQGDAVFAKRFVRSIKTISQSFSQKQYSNEETCEFVV